MKRGLTSNRRILNIVIHVAAWTVFILLPFLIMSKDPAPWEVMMQHNPYFILVQVFTNVYLIAFYYGNSFILIPRLLANKKILVYALIIVVLLVIYVFVPEYIFRTYIFLHPKGPRHRFRLFPLPGSAALFLLIFVISSSVKIIQQWFSAEQLKEKAEKEKLRTELSFLKSQVNPHFLFNTLNNIYAMAITGSDHTADAVMKLSQIMRYILQDADHEFVSLQKEIGFVQHYIELQQFRLSSKVDIEFEVEGNPEQPSGPGEGRSVVGEGRVGEGRSGTRGPLRIAPLLLIPFIENAFKYGVSARDASYINIRINIRENIVTLWVKNSKHPGNMANAGDNTGIGLTNTRRRLALLYPDKHDLAITDAADHFEVTLQITCG